MTTERKNNAFKNNAMASLLFPDGDTKTKNTVESTNTIKPFKPNPLKQKEKNESKKKTEQVNALASKFLQMKRERSYSPTSSHIKQVPVKIPKVIPAEKPTETKQVDVNQNPKIPVIQRKPLLTTEDELLDKLKNFSSMDDLCENIAKYRDSYDDILSKEKDIVQQERKSKEEQTRNNAPMTFAEKRKLDKIDEVNEVLLKQRPTLVKTKFISRISNDKTEIPFNPKEKFCSECLCMHLPNEHRERRNPKIDYKKIFPDLHAISCEELNKKQKDKRELLLQQLKKEEQKQKEKQKKIKEEKAANAAKKQSLNSKCEKMIQQINENKRMNNKKNEEKKTTIPKVNGIFSREDFEDEYTFMDKDESDRIYLNYLQKITGASYRFATEEDDIEEANFDDIQKEEKRTAQIGDYEDEQEEIKEKERKERKHHRHHHHHHHHHRK